MGLHKSIKKQRKKRLIDCGYIRTIDIQFLFLGGFSFLIACFDKVMALRYLITLFFAIIVMSILNGLGLDEKPN